MGADRKSLQKIRNLSALLGALAITGCSSYFNKRANQEKGEDLDRTFEIQDKKFDKFKVIAPDPTPEPTPIPAESTPTPAPKKNVKAPKKIIIKPTPAPAAVKIPKTLPEGYPPELKKLEAKAKPLWDSYKPASLPGENTVVAVSLVGLSVGNLYISHMPTVKIGGQSAHHYKVRFITDKFYEKFYKIDDTLESFVLVGTNLPIRYSLVQRESGQSVDDLQFFDFEKLKTFHWYRRLKNGEEKKNELEAWMPGLTQDALSAMFFARGLPLEQGRSYEIPVMNKGKLWVTKITVLGDSEAKYDKKWVKAIQLRAENQMVENPEKKNVIDFWYSADAEKRLLKFSSKIKLGAVEGDTLLYESGRPD